MRRQESCSQCGVDRRAFLKSGGLALVAGALLPGVFVRMGHASASSGRRVLVTLFQRGAVDGLNVVIPYGDSAYYTSRSAIAIPRPNRGEGAGLDLDGYFALHPAMAPLLPYYRNGSAAFVHAVGSPDATRSHFDAQDFMESGTPGRKSTADGFLGRALVASARAKPSPLRAVSMTSSTPRILSGSSEVVAMTSIEQFGIRAGRDSSSAAASFESLYSGAVANTLGDAAHDSFEAIRALESSKASSRRPEHGAVYPRGPLGTSLAQIAQLIKANVGLEIAFTDVGGWDTHAGQGGSQGQLANLLRNYAAAIDAFVKDLGPRMSDVVLVSVSEFGRTVAENGNRGTDHGHGNVMMLLGGSVRGGAVHGQWPGLGKGQLFEGRDLAVTTDFRDVFGEVLTRHLGVTDLRGVFPGYDVSRAKWRGVMRG